MNMLTPAPKAPSVSSPIEQHLLLDSTVFRAHSPAHRLYVLVRARPGTLFTLAEMEAVAQDQWQVSLLLPPGTYRYRYLAELEGPAAYVSPAEAEETPPPMRRLDATLTVRATG